MFPVKNKNRMLPACRAKRVGLPEATMSSQPQEVQQEEPPTWNVVDENTRWNCYWAIDFYGWWLAT